MEMRRTDPEAPIVVKVPAGLMFFEPVLSLGYTLVSWVVKPFHEAPWALLIFIFIFGTIWVGVGFNLLRRQVLARNTALVLSGFGVLGSLSSLKILGFLSVLQLAICLGIFIPLMTKSSRAFFAKT